MKNSILALLLLLAVPGMVHAQAADAATGANAGADASQPAPSDAYISIDPASAAFGVPSGMLNVGGMLTPTPFNTTPAEVSTDNMINYLGCGGVGQADYTSALFKSPEVFEKFKSDVNTDLAKQLLTYNLSMPQTAALFGTLNTYGNERYTQFQTGCKLNTLKEDARQQYLTACIAKIKDNRKTVIQQAQTSGATGGATGSAPQQLSAEDLESQAYAQSWEICMSRYAEQTASTGGTANPGQANAKEARDLLKEMNTAFAKEIRRVENVNEAIRPYLCQASGTATAPAEGTASAAACWPMLFLPQVRLCHDSTLTEPSGDTSTNSTGCTGEYGTRDPLLNMSRYFDMLRYTLTRGLVDKIIHPLENNLMNLGVSPDTRDLAAQAAAYNLGTQSTSAADGQQAAQATATAASTIPGADDTTKDFQQSYLNCKRPDIMDPIKAYTNEIDKQINTPTTGQGTTTFQQSNSGPMKALNATFTVEDYKRMAPLIEGISSDQLAVLNATALGCTANQTIPMFDPNITSNLSQCDADEREAYYAISSHDVALHATRDVYQYIALRLKQTYGRLLNESLRYASSSTAISTINSPELNRRLANAIKDIMLPYVEDQIKRLEQTAESRGIFAQRVQKIYATKEGCINP